MIIKAGIQQWAHMHKVFKMSPVVPEDTQSVQHGVSGVEAVADALTGRDVRLVPGHGRSQRQRRVARRVRLYA